MENEPTIKTGEVNRSKKSESASKEKKGGTISIVEKLISSPVFKQTVSPADIKVGEKIFFKDTGKDGATYTEWNILTAPSNRDRGSFILRSTDDATQNSLSLETILKNGYIKKELSKDVKELINEELDRIKGSMEKENDADAFNFWEKKRELLENNPLKYFIEEGKKTEKRVKDVEIKNVKTQELRKIISELKVVLPETTPEIAPFPTKTAKTSERIKMSEPLLKKVEATREKKLKKFEKWGKLGKIAAAVALSLATGSSALRKTEKGENKAPRPPVATTEVLPESKISYENTDLEKSEYAERVREANEKAKLVEKISREYEEEKKHKAINSKKVERRVEVAPEISQVETAAVEPEQETETAPTPSSYTEYSAEYAEELRRKIREQPNIDDIDVEPKPKPERVFFNDETPPPPEPVTLIEKPPKPEPVKRKPWWQRIFS